MYICNYIRHNKRTDEKRRLEWFLQRDPGLFIRQKSSTEDRSGRLLSNSPYYSSSSSSSSSFAGSAADTDGRRLLFIRHFNDFIELRRDACHYWPLSTVQPCDFSCIHRSTVGTVSFVEHYRIYVCLLYSFMKRTTVIGFEGRWRTNTRTPWRATENWCGILNDYSKNEKMFNE